MDYRTNAVAAEVAAILGDGWAQGIGERRHCIGHRDGRSICFRPDNVQQPRRWHISAYVPSDPVHGRRSFRPDEMKTGLREHHEISVTVIKTPEQIARDIARRLLPDYTRSAEANAKWVEERQQELARLEDVISRLAEIGVSAGACTRDDARTTNHREPHLVAAVIPSSDHRSPVHGEFRPSYDAESVHISLDSVPVPMAELIMNVIAAYPKGTG
jgi:hypothetical protein